eukprot:403331654
MNDTEYGVVTGTAFTIINCCFGMFMGYLADRVTQRKYFLLFCSLMMNVFTGVSYFTQSFLQILIPRMFHAVFLSACVPISVSLINDYFDKESLGKANSFYCFGIYIGVGLSSLTLLIDRACGWRNSILIVCTICSGFGLLCLILIEPKRQKIQSDQGENSQANQNLSSKEYLDEQDNSHVQPIIPLSIKLKEGIRLAFGLQTFSQRPMLTMSHAQINFWVSMAGLYFAYLTAEVWYGIIFSMINQIFPSEFQGQAIAAFQLLGCLAGALGTFFLGLLGDHFQVDDYPHRFGYILGTTVLISYVGSFPFFLWSGHEFKKILSDQQKSKNDKEIVKSFSKSIDYSTKSMSN